MKATESKKFCLKRARVAMLLECNPKVTLRDQTITQNHNIDIVRTSFTENFVCIANMANIIRHEKIFLTTLNITLLLGKEIN